MISEKHTKIIEGAYRELEMGDYGIHTKSLVSLIKKGEALRWLEENSYELRCRNVSTYADDYYVQWYVVGHWQSKPKERELGCGETPLDAIQNTINDYELR